MTSLTLVDDGNARAAIVIQADEPKAMSAGLAFQAYV